MRSGRPSLTARWIAAQRAGLARGRPSTPTGAPEAEARLYAGMGRLFVLPGLRPTGMRERTAFIDGEVARAIGSGVEQIVIVGAGYDGRALRFGGTSTRWIEVDYPATQVDKRRRLAAAGVPDTGDVAYVGLDLLTDDLDGALDDAGQDPNQRSLFICEGLFAYLTLDAGASLCRSLRNRAAEGSVLAANFRVAPPARPLARSFRGVIDLMLAGIGETRRMDFRPGDPEKLLTITGWRVARATTSAPNRVDEGSHLLVLAAEPAS